EARRGVENMRTEQAKVVAPFDRAAKQVQSVLPDTTEQSAFLAHTEGISGALVESARMGPDARNAVIAHIAENANVTPEAAALALDVATGTNPELAYRFGQARAYLEHAAGPESAKTERYLTNRGARPNEAEFDPEYRQWQVEGTEPRLQGPQAAKLER